MIANVVVEIGGGGGGGVGHGPDSDNGLYTLEPILPTSIPSHTYPSPDMYIPPHTGTSPSIPPHTYTSVPYPVSLKPPSIAVDITLSSHSLSSHTLPPMDDTILDFLPELGPLPARRPWTRRVHRLLHPSVPSAPSAPSAISAPSQTPHDSIA